MEVGKPILHESRRDAASASDVALRVSILELIKAAEAYRRAREARVMDRRRRDTRTCQEPQ